jgi:hypothetical protein
LSLAHFFTHEFGVEDKMSVELPEASILAGQLKEELPGKRIAACDLRNFEGMNHVADRPTSVQNVRRGESGLT